jgi:hypothetical protein
MHTLNIILPTFYGQKKLNFKAPEAFNDISRKQLIGIVRLIFSDMKPIDKKTWATKILYGLKWWHIMLFKPLEMSYINNTYSKWVFDEDQNLTDNKIKTISLGLFKKKLYGPMGETLTASEWTSADGAYTEFLETQDLQHLDNLISILWRPRAKNINPKGELFTNDYRVSYNSHTVERRAAAIANIDTAIKYSILLWYKGCRLEWEEIFDKVFSSGTKEQVESYGWPETIQKVSGSKFGSLQETRKVYMHEVLFNMQIEIKDHDYWKRKNQDKQNA